MDGSAGCDSAEAAVPVQGLANTENGSSGQSKPGRVPDAAMDGIVQPRNLRRCHKAENRKIDVDDVVCSGVAIATRNRDDAVRNKKPRIDGKAAIRLTMVSHKSKKPKDGCYAN